MSAMIMSTWHSPWVTTRYLPTHVTRWSLKLPLRSWWRRSGAIRSWMSVQGKWTVKGYIVSVSASLHHIHVQLNLPQHYRLYHNLPTTSTDPMFGVAARYVFGCVALHRCPSHHSGPCIWKNTSTLIRSVCCSTWNLLTLHTSLARCKQAALAQDNPLCKDLTRIWHDEGGHLHIRWHRA